ncbi:MAG: CHAT domain-containing tetratricopeptide repeat protein [Saprospiraceae bacterium]|nr:CHAT domain-containing tetratricopeptide repeat protein [Saprospiraceae bacterium]
MSNSIFIHDIQNYIITKFNEKKDYNPIGERYQEMFLKAFQANQFRHMGIILEYAGDYFSNTPNGTQEAVFFYQDAIFLLAMTPEGENLQGVVLEFGSKRKELSSNGDLFMALDLFQLTSFEGEPSLEREDPEQSIRILFKCGTSMLKMPQVGMANKIFDRALALCAAGTFDGSMMEAKIKANKGAILGRSRILEEVAQGRKNLRDIQKTFEKAGLQYEVGKTLSMLAGVEQANDQKKEAARLYRAALKIYETFGIHDRRGTARCFTNAGILSLKNNDYSRALEYFKTALTFADGLNIPELIWPIQWGLGCSYLAKKEYDFAEENLASSIQYIEAFQDDLYCDEGKATFIEGVQFVYGKMFEVLIGCQRKFKTNFEKILDLMERSRAQSLEDLISSKSQIKGETVDSMDTIETPLKEPWRLVFKVLPNHTISLLVNHKGVVIKGNVLRKSEKEWEQDLLTFYSIIGSGHFDRDAMIPFEPIETRPIKHSEYFNKLYTELLRPFTAKMPHKGTLLLVEPDGPLWQLPLHLLQFPNHEAFVADFWPLVYAPSYDVYSAIKKAKAPPVSKEDQFYFGGLNDAQTIEGTQFNRLDHAENEVETIAKNILGLPDRHVFTGIKFTESEATTRIPGSRIIHLSAHGKADMEEPLESYIVLNGSTLTAAEVSKMKIPHCELVALSACKTGLGKVMSEGMVGLARAFQIAGARSLLVSLWSVGDASTKKMMEYFYQHLKLNGGHKALALQAAMQTLRAEQGNNAFAQWAPFVLIGVEDSVMVF